MNNWLPFFFILSLLDVLFRNRESGMLWVFLQTSPFLFRGKEKYFSRNTPPPFTLPLLALLRIPSNRQVGNQELHKVWQ